MNRLTNIIDPVARADGPPPDTLWAFFVWAFRGSFPVMAIGGALSVITGTIEVLSALILGLLIDAALNVDKAQFFDTNMGLLIGVAAFFIILRPVVMGLSAIVQGAVLRPALMTVLFVRLHRHTLGQSVKFFDDDFAGRIAQKQGQASRSATNVVIEFIHTILFAAASLIGSVLLMFTIDIRTAALVAIWVVAYVALIRYFLPRIRLSAKAKAARNAMVTGQVVDTVTNIKTVKLFAHDQFEDRTAIEALQKLRLATVDYGWLAARFRFYLMGLAGILPLAILGATLLFWTQGTATAGDIAVAGAIGLRLAQMTGWVSFTLLGMYSDIGVVEDAIRTLSPAHTLVDAPRAQPIKVEQGQIKFEDVTFTYAGGAGGLHGVNLTIGAGEKLGIVGASGAGKSTLVSVLLRLYDTEKGGILIDDQDLRDVTQDSLRSQIGMVTQETAMFNRSARDNIAYGRPDATLAEIKAAATQAEADGFITDLRDHTGRHGYDAHLGERGVKLSGGQRQRIAIARAILKDAPILVLDEATSALDSEVEASIQTALETVMQGKTVIAIAHRLSTLARMDRIIVLDAGQIKEQGTHADLLRQDGLYARYWNRQSGGFINVKDAAE